MRVRGERRLRAKEIAALKPGTHEDGGGLRLVVEQSGARRWVLRVTIAGKRRNRGLGPCPLVSLEKARDAALDIRRAAREGRDLTDEQRRERARTVTFREAFDTFFDLSRQGLSNAKHLKQWPATMQTYVFPSIGDRPVPDITHADILAILEPIWFEKPETAKRVLQRLEAVFKSAILRGQREKASPCIGIAQELGRDHRNVQHHRALPYAEVPAFIQTLRSCRSNPVTKLAFEWLILTATRSSETRGAMRTEVDETTALWVIPKERMKGRKKDRREHVVPLSARCLQIVHEARTLNPDSELLFPGPYTGVQLSDMTLTKVLRDLKLADRATAHGFRSSFRDWATEVYKAREVVSEAALAHGVRDKAEAAYRRATYLDERRELMHGWTNFVLGRVI
jgi:integrase